MTAVAWGIWCGAYMVGLFLTAIPVRVWGLPIGAIALPLLGLITGLLVPRIWRTAPRAGIWLIAGLVGLVAVVYMQVRIPQPGSQDVSRLIPTVEDTTTPATRYTVRGWITTAPRLTRNQKIQFQLDVMSAAEVVAQGAIATPQPATGAVYITVPLLQGTGLHPGQQVAVSGSLYRPKPAANPGGFDFQKYLAQQGIFAGLSGQWVDIPNRNEQLLTPVGTVQFWLWQVQQRMVRSHVTALGVPEGPLLSTMVMGRNGVDLDYDLRDQFTRSGLAHALAASGFQVSLLAGVVIALTGRLANRTRLILGISVLLAYIGLTGIQPSVLRAGIMGVAVLIALTTERKVKPLGSLLLAATLLLLYNPLWIWDLGFQFSFLATLGLLVTVPILSKWLDWLPTTIASLVAVPIAAYLWTLPLQLQVFGVMSPYSIPINILTTPLITVISMGGMISALAALLYPLAGSLTSWLLYYPTHWLIVLAEWGNRLPGNAIAIGTLSLTQVLLLYGLILVVWWQPRLWKYWWMAGMIGISAIALPLAYQANNFLQATVLATREAPVLAIQDRQHNTVVNSGDPADINFTLLPFLRQAGINQMDWAIAPSLSPANASNWFELANHLPIQVLYTGISITPPSAPLPVLDRLKAQHGTHTPLLPNQPVSLGSSQIQWLHPQLPILQFQIGGHPWLFLQSLTPQQQTALPLPQSEVLWWSGEELTPALLEHVKPEVAIATARTIPPNTSTWLQQHHVTTYITGRDGAIQWTPQTGFVEIIPRE